MLCYPAADITTRNLREKCFAIIVRWQQLARNKFWTLLTSYHNNVDCCNVIWPCKRSILLLENFQHSKLLRRDMPTMGSSKHWEPAEGRIYKIWNSEQEKQGVFGFLLEIWVPGFLKICKVLLKSHLQVKTNEFILFLLLV